MVETGSEREPLRATLHELGLLSQDVEQLARFYSNALGYSFTHDLAGCLGLARDRRLRLNSGPKNTLGYAAYAMPELSDLNALTSRLSEAGIPFEGISLIGMGDALKFRDPDGNVLVFGLGEEGQERLYSGLADRPARLQHIVFASTNVTKMLQFYTGVVGFTLSDRVLDDQGNLKTVFVRCSHEHHSQQYLQLARAAWITTAMRPWSGI
jgi:catechol 2,3-dioxygenase